MKTILQRCKQLVQDNAGAGQTLFYVKDTEIIHPELAWTTISSTNMPKILFTPMGSVERWVASQKKEAEHRIAAYIILEYHMRETSIIGDANRTGAQGKGILDIVNDFLTVFRGQRFSTGGTPYLDRPMDVESIEYFKPQIGQEPQMLVAEVVMNCSRLFLQATLPGDV